MRQQRLVKYNTAVVIDGITFALGGAYGGGYNFVSNPPFAAGDVQVSIDGGVFANIATLPTVVPAADTSVRLSLSAAELLGKKINVRFIDQTATKAWDDMEVLFETYGDASANFKFDLDNSDIDAIKAKTDQLAFISGDVVATLDGETVSVSPSSGGVKLADERFEDFPESSY